MRKLAVGAVALATLGSPAIAADMGVRPHYAPVVAYTNWSGCHIGGTVGLDWGNDAGYSAGPNTTGAILGVPPIIATTGPITPGPITNSFNMSGFTGGGYGGCDYQFGAWVVGVEGDWQIVNKEGQSGFVPGPIPGASGVVIATPTGPATFTVNNVMSAKERYVATARARVGYAVDKWLFFVSGGAAWAKVDTSFFCTGQGTTLGASAAFQCNAQQGDRQTGWTVGGGFDYAITSASLMPGWSVRVEYLYVSLPSYTTLTSPSFAGVAGSAIPFNVNNGRLTDSLVRVGFAYKFGNYAAPAVYK